MTSHKSIMAWGDYGPESVTGRWSANTYDADDAVEYVLKSDFEKVRFAADLGLKMAEVNDLWNTAETIKAALTQTTDKEPAQPDPVGWVCAIEQAVAVADAKRQKYATAAHEKPDPWAQNAAKSLCADDISAAIRSLITQPQHDALAAHVAAEVAKARADEAADSFAKLIADAKAEAEKAMRKFPQPNYVITKFAEEAGEVVKAAVHCAEARETVENLRGEMVQAIAMLYRLWVEGDQVHGLLSMAEDFAVMKGGE